MQRLRTTCLKQKGAVTLLTALVLLLSITLITLSSSKTVLVESKTVADNHRMTQTVTSANYAMDLGFNYFDQGGFDQNSDDLIDTTADIDGNGSADNFNDLVLTSTLGAQSTSSNLVFNNQADTLCLPMGSSVNMRQGLIQTTGYSDDGIAKRSLTQCVGPLKILINGGPDQPLISKGQVEFNGNTQIINRYSTINIWSGSKVTLGISSPLATYIKNPSAEQLSQAQLISTTTDNTQLVSNRNLGNGLDIIDKDPSLSTLSGDAFFNSFFTVSSRVELKNLAMDSGQNYSNVLDALGKSGLIWIEEAPGVTVSLDSNGTIGTANTPAIILVNGDFEISSQNTIYGLLYIVGKYFVTGTMTIIGTIIVEGTNTSSGLPAIDPIVENTGSLNLVYWQKPYATSFFPGQGAIIDGSWKDW